MRLFTCICLSVLLSACTMAPRIANQPYNVQDKLVSVSQWQTLAKEVVEFQVMPSLPVNPEYARVYVDESDYTDFGKAFHNYLLTELISHGVVESDIPDNANVVKWDTQLVWNDKGPWMPGVFMGTMEFIGYFVAGSSSMVPPDTVEVIITTQVNRENFILSRNVHNYYLSEKDKWNFYAPSKNAMKETAAAPMARNFEYKSIRPTSMFTRSDGIMVYSEPNYSKIIGTLPAGTELTAIGKRNNWYIVELSRNKTGWVVNDSVE